MNEMFWNNYHFDQDLSDWNIELVNNFQNAFNQSLSTTKGLIHKSFSSNPSRPYDWSEFVEDSPTDPIPPFQFPIIIIPKHSPNIGVLSSNQTRDFVPFPGGYGMGSGTVAKWIQENLDRDKKNNAGEPKSRDRQKFN